MKKGDEFYLENLRAHASDARRLFSNSQKPERERMVVRAFLRCIGEQFTTSEVRASNIEPVDTIFRTARFQVRDIVGDRKRGKEWVEREKKYEHAEQPSDLLEPWVSSTPMTFGEVSIDIANALTEKANRYGPKSCAILDALVYVDLHNHHLYPLEPRLDIAVADEFDRQGWRSVSFVFVPYGAILVARPSSPDFLRHRVGHILNKWPRPDRWFEA